MKKLIGTLLAMVLVVNIFSVNVFAEEPNKHVLTEEEIELLLDSSDMQLDCPECGGNSTLIRSWSEWTYYYTYIWAAYSCDDCGNVWSTCIATLPNMTSDEDKEDKDIMLEYEVDSGEGMLN